MTQDNQGKKMRGQNNAPPGSGAQDAPMQAAVPDIAQKGDIQEKHPKEKWFDIKRRRKTLKDIAVAMIAGFIIGIIMRPLLSSNAQENRLILLAYENWIVFSFVLAFVSGLCMAVAYLVARVFTSVLQIARFILVGGLNTILDNSVLTLLMRFFTAYFFGASLSLFGAAYAERAIFVFSKSLSFVVASTNSYFWNKWWTFRKKDTEKTKREIVAFYAVTIAGFGINVLAAYLIFAAGPVWNLNVEQWWQISGLCATAASMVWNFVGYKFIVFKK